MFKLQDFFHLPQVDTLIEKMIADGPGLVVVAGLDPRLPEGPASSDQFLPSGRITIFRILLEEILAAQPKAKCTVVTADRKLVRIPRELRNRIELSLVKQPQDYASQIEEAIQHRPGLLVIDQLSAETAPAAFHAAQQGLRVLSQLDTVFRGASAARHLLDLGVPRPALSNLTWILAVQRMATLCPQCKQPAIPDASQLARLRQHYPRLAELLGEEFSFRWAQAASQPGRPQEKPSPAKKRQPSHPASEPPQGPPQETLIQGEIGTFYQAGGCPACRGTGRHGDVAVFDIFRPAPGGEGLFEQPSLLAMETYVLHLASLGRLPLDDFLEFEAAQSRRMFNLFTASERLLVTANTDLERQLVQLEAAHRVLQQRSEALISLHNLGQALIASTELDELADRVCRRARDLCSADRAILYLQRPDERAEVLAVSGWDRALLPRQVEARLVFEPQAALEPAPFNRLPPGVPPPFPDREPIRAGLSVPLIAQEKRVGQMIVHTTQKARFEPGEVALLKTFANQAALAIQRAGLIEQLRDKIAELETAQAELAQKERLEREMELARQVQQSVLPRTFPQVPGYLFAAHNEPARQVGGDFYDVISLDEDHFGIAIADVSDKGMPAALYMALTRSLLRAEARRELSPQRVIANVNRLLLELSEPNHFVTVFYGVVERATRRLTYTRAGHDRPVLLRSGSVLELDGKGIALGIMDEQEFSLTEERLDLASGDRLVLYTDGLCDILSPADQRFERQPLLSLFQSYAGLPPESLCAAVFAHLDLYRAGTEQYDDMTMLVLSVEE